MEALVRQPQDDLFLVVNGHLDESKVVERSATNQSHGRFTELSMSATTSGHLFRLWSLPPTVHRSYVWQLRLTESLKRGDLSSATTANVLQVELAATTDPDSWQVICPSLRCYLRSPGMAHCFDDSPGALVRLMRQTQSATGCTLSLLETLRLHSASGATKSVWSPTNSCPQGWRTSVGANDSTTT